MDYITLMLYCCVCFCFCHLKKKNYLVGATAGQRGESVVRHAGAVFCSLSSKTGRPGDLPWINSDPEQEEASVCNGWVEGWTGK